MAENSANTAKMVRFLAITQILIGVVLLCFGIAERLVLGGPSSYGNFGVWNGILVSNFFLLHADKKEKTKGNEHVGMHTGANLTIVSTNSKW